MSEAKVPGGRYWEPQEERTEEELEREWQEFLEWSKEEHEEDADLPFN